MKNEKPVIAIAFLENGENGGPYVSHMRIMNSALKNKYDFVPIFFPRLRECIKPKVLRSIVAEIKKANPVLFHVAGLQLDGFVEVLSGKLAKVKTVCAIRGSSNEAVYLNSTLRRIIPVFEKWTLKKADACYSVSSYVANWQIVKRYAKNNFGYIYNFYDFQTDENNSYIADKRKEMRASLGISNDAIVVISTGRITKEKGYETVLNVIKKTNENEKLVYLIVGDGEYKNTLEEQLKQEINQNRVFLLGYKKNVSDYLDASDIYLSCTWHETFGNSIIEGSFHRLPIVASNVGGVPEIVENGVTGFLVNTSDVDSFAKSVMLLANDEQTRKKCGSNGYHYVKEKFNPTRIAKELDQVYHAVMCTN